MSSYAQSIFIYGNGSEPRLLKFPNSEPGLIKFTGPSPKSTSNKIPKNLVL